MQVKIGPIPKNDFWGPHAWRMVVTDTLTASTGELEGMEPGTRVEVRDRFRGSWSRGFELVEPDGEGYRVRRVSDGSVLPAVFDADDVRVERRRRQGLWWYS